MTQTSQVTKLVPENWSPPKWSKELMKEFHDLMLPHMKYDNHRHKIQFLNQKPLCVVKKAKTSPLVSFEYNYIPCNKDLVTRMEFGGLLLLQILIAKSVLIIFSKIFFTPFGSK